MPYGWQPIALAVPSGQLVQHLFAEEESAVMYVQPFLAANLVSMASDFSESAEYLKIYLTDPEISDDPAWKNVTTLFVDWLQDMASTASKSLPCLTDQEPPEASQVSNEKASLTSTVLESSGTALDPTSQVSAASGTDNDPVLDSGIPDIS